MALPFIGGSSSRPRRRGRRLIGKLSGCVWPSGCAVRVRRPGGAIVRSSRWFPNSRWSSTTWGGNENVSQCWWGPRCRRLGCDERGMAAKNVVSRSGGCSPDIGRRRRAPSSQPTMLYVREDELLDDLVTLLGSTDAEPAGGHAVLPRCDETGIDVDVERQASPRRSEIPFEIPEHHRDSGRPQDSDQGRRSPRTRSASTPTCACPPRTDRTRVAAPLAVHVSPHQPYLKGRDASCRRRSARVGQTSLDDRLDSGPASARVQGFR